MANEEKKDRNPLQDRIESLEKEILQLRSQNIALRQQLLQREQQELAEEVSGSYPEMLNNNNI